MKLRDAAGAASLIAAVLLATSCGAGGTDGRPVAEDTATPSAAPTSSVPAPPPAPSDEDQIRQTVQAFQDAYNTQNWDAYRQQMCPSMRDRFTDGPVMDLLKKTRAENGLTRASVSAVQIDGDTATVTLEAQSEALGSGTPTLPLERDDGWKVCVRY